MKIEKKAQQLEALVEALESEDTDLDTAVEKYTQALKITKELTTILQDIQTKIARLDNEAATLTKELSPS